MVNECLSNTRRLNISQTILVKNDGHLKKDVSYSIYRYVFFFFFPLSFLLLYIISVQHNQPHRSTLFCFCRRYHSRLSGRGPAFQRSALPILLQSTAFLSKSKGYILKICNRELEVPMLQKKVHVLRRCARVVRHNVIQATTSFCTKTS